MKWKVYNKIVNQLIKVTEDSYFDCIRDEINQSEEIMINCFIRNVVKRGRKSQYASHLFETLLQDCVVNKKLSNGRKCFIFQIIEKFKNGQKSNPIC